MTFLLLASSSAFGEQLSLAYENSTLDRNNLYEHFLGRNMKMNLLKDVREARKQLEHASADSVWPSYKFISDVSAMEFSYLLFWYFQHQKAIKDGCRPYWVTEKEMDPVYISHLAENMRVYNRQPGYITSGLIKIADRITKESGFLKSGEAQHAVQNLLKNELWCNENMHLRESEDGYKHFRTMLEKSEIYSIIDEISKKCKFAD